MIFHKDLIDKYNVPVPRYTSYPPANYFSEGINSDKAANLYAESNNTETQQVSFYIHIPFCKTICFYCGCNAQAMGKSSQVEPYIEAVKKEIKMMKPFIDASRPVTQLHYGGGTPNAVPAEYLKEINELLFREFNFTPDAEIAIEVNPAHLPFSYINTLKEAGFNRFSLGIQDFNNDVLKLVNRKPSALPVNELMDYIRTEGKPASVNLDFIYGLPSQTVESFEGVMRKAAELKPDRLVTFSYAHVPWMKKHQKTLEKFGLPGPHEKFAMFLKANEILNESGYKTLGLDHFVLPDDELYQGYENHQLHRNFQGYCTRKTTGQVYAFGVSGISQLDNAYIQYTKNTQEYIKAVEEGCFAVEKGLVLNVDQKLIREVITQLMCNKQVSWAEIAQRHNVIKEHLLNVLQFDPKNFNEFVKDDLMELDEDGIKVKSSGSMFIRNIAAALDPAYSPAGKKFSKSV